MKVIILVDVGILEWIAPITILWLLDIGQGGGLIVSLPFPTNKYRSFYVSCRKILEDWSHEPSYPLHSAAACGAQADVEKLVLAQVRANQLDLELQDVRMWFYF